MRGKELLHAAMVHLGVAAASTQTTDRERTLLGELARGRRRIVELGVFEGVTARVLRSAMSSDGRLWLVDPFLPGRLGICYSRSIARREVGMVRNGEVTFVRRFSVDAVTTWDEPIDLLFVDADHSYDAVRRDWDDWKRFILPGGVVAFHDSNVFDGGWVGGNDGPVRVVEEIRRDEPSFQTLRGIDSLSVFERR